MKRNLEFSKGILKGALVSLLLVATAGMAQARDQIRIVGSSTVYPFASYVAEEFGVITDYATPVLESTGSGGGLKLFCAGNDMQTPDITNASRQMKTSEFKLCAKNGVDQITEVVIGYDGIAIAQKKGGQTPHLTREELTLAVAAEVPKGGKLVKNFYTRWNQINPDLPNEEILILGPPSTSGTRDAFEELVMEAASEEMPGYGKEEYSNIRQDGVYVPSGENDNLIVQKLLDNPDALGIFGYSFLEENSDRLVGAYVDGVAPTPENISSGAYPVSRSLFFYVKRSHLGKVSGLAEYVDMFLSERMIGEMGYLKRIGLVPLPAEMRQDIRERWENRVDLTLGDLK